MARFTSRCIADASSIFICLYSFCEPCTGIALSILLIVVRRVLFLRPFGALLPMFKCRLKPWIKSISKLASGFKLLDGCLVCQEGPSSPTLQRGPIG
eukprot:CAMPEP_0206592238 /NCGR_PEP_ID=MMETSP0325_2-20121206/40815_1 /ASSEMBLY_ACC=CAM_ASM_000347 /TAXON_ID=2866 /ORGANISM="Crypthecodinium cohnii, Strain Seligo" /LENGTH=96 /DNA_ID=CAMNT_0054101781 /DNA_START=144 /DNA_END=434 /DNA_ORIENTATION=-